MENEKRTAAKDPNGNKVVDAGKSPKLSSHRSRRSSVTEAGEKPLFEVNQSLLCKYLDGKSYACRVINLRECSDGGFEYLVHYKDWNKRYDEWVHQSKLSPGEGSVRRHKRVREVVDVQEEASPKQVQDRCVFHRAVDFCLSERFMAILEKDEKEMRCHVIKLPATPSISNILEMYQNARREKEDSTPKLVCRQMVKLVNKCLLGWLLYEVETSQHKALCTEHPNKDACELYSFVHLLRLLYSLPELLRYFLAKDEAVAAVVTAVYDFTSFLEARVDEYEAAVTYIPL
uniref:Uncharacterized protein n=1 Tax=Trichuris muris TaxID=70415 RepID=A0A5S6PZH8_TRIMR